MRNLLSLAVLAALPGMASAVEVDGRIDEAGWAGARHITDFRLTQPLSREPTPHPTDTWPVSRNAMHDKSGPISASKC